jgi:hypothetical protein
MGALLISVSVTDNATPAISRVRTFLQGEDVKQLVGQMAVNAFGVNFDNKNQISNALGGPRTNYYSDARKATSFEVSGDTVTIAVKQVGISLHYYGGTVTPIRTKYLTIPARPECHGKRASDFPDLIVLWGRKGPYGLGLLEKVGIGTVGASKPNSTVYFWLVKKATIAPDPTVIPEDSALLDPIAEKLGQVAERRFNEEGDSE